MEHLPPYRPASKNVLRVETVRQNFCCAHVTYFIRLELPLTILTEVFPRSFREVLATYDVHMENGTGPMVDL